MRTTYSRLLIAALFSMTSAVLFSQSGPYFGQTDPGLTPKRFAPAKVPLGAFAITFSPDGMECFTTRNLDTINFIWTSREENGSWINFEIASFSGTYPDAEAHIVPDGSKMYFGSARPLPGSSEVKNRTWCVTKQDTGWSEPVPMDPPLRDIFMMYPSVATNLNMYFTATDSTWNQWIAVSRYVDGAYQEPERLSDSINYLPYPAHPFIAPDESYIIVDAVTDTSTWARKLYISFRKPDGSWTRATDMGSTINTAVYNMFPFVSRDGKYFFFGRNNFQMWVNANYIEGLRPRYGTYLGESPPDTIPKKFAPGFFYVQSGSVYSCTFSPALDEIYFSRYSSSGNNIWFSEMVDSVWTKPAKAQFTQSYWTIEPNFAPDGNRLFFVSDMSEPPPGTPTNILQIWYVDRTPDGWSVPVKLNEPFSDSMKMYPSVASNGNLYFTESNGPNWNGIYRSEFFNGSYQIPVMLDNAINRFYVQAHSYVTPDERHMIFDASPEGPPDWKTYLYISHRNPDGSWQDAVKLSETINATESQYCGYISPDQQFLFFARNNAEGGTDLWWVRADQILHPAGINEHDVNDSSPGLLQNFPNPVTDRTTICFSVRDEGRVQLQLLDLSGKIIRTFLDEVTKPGKYHISVEVPDIDSGIYLYRLLTNSGTVTKKMTIIH